MAFNPANLSTRFIQAGVEATKGSVATLTDVLANVGATIQPNSNFVERAVSDGETGTFGGVHTSKVWQSQIAFENKGGGASSPIPEITAFLQACSLGYSAAVVLPITGASGDFTLGETVTSDDTTPATGRVLGQTATQLFIDTVTNTFGAAAGLTGGASGETATMNGSPIDSAVYIPVSAFADQKTISIRDVREHDQRVGLYTMGDGTFSFAVEAIPSFEGTFTSLYTAPVAPVATVGAVSTVTPDPWIGAEFEINGVPCGDFAISAFSLALGNTVSQVKGACATDGIVGITVTQASPVLTVTITKPPLATFNPYTLRDDNTKFEVWTHHGAGTGERVRVGIPQGQITQISEGEEEGRENYTLTISATKAGGANVPKFHVIYW